MFVANLITVLPGISRGKDMSNILGESDEEEKKKKKPPRKRKARLTELSDVDDDDTDDYQVSEYVRLFYCDVFVC